MNIKSKYKAWIGEKHADIAHKLTGNDIETFALEFAEHLIKNCSAPDVISSASFKKDLEKAIEMGEDVGFNEGGGYDYFNQSIALEAVINVLKKHLL